MLSLFFLVTLCQHSLEKETKTADIWWNEKLLANNFDLITETFLSRTEIQRILFYSLQLPRMDLCEEFVRFVRITFFSSTPEDCFWFFEQEPKKK